MSDDKDMMMLRFKTAIDRELKRSETSGAKPPPRTQPPKMDKPE